MNDQDRIAHAVGLLMCARAGGPKAPNLGPAAPRDEAEAWAIQRAVLGATGGSIGGYKCATPAGRPASGAALDARGILRGPARFRLPPGQAKVGLETEVAFRMARDLPPRGTPWTREEVIEAVAGCFPAIELVLSRYVDPAGVSLNEAMADAVAHGALICGADVPDWRARDLEDLEVFQSYGGTEQVRRRGGNPAGPALVSLARYANHLHGFGLMLKAGDVVTTGSWTGMIWVEPGAKAVGGFAGLGQVEVEIG